MTLSVSCSRVVPGRVNGFYVRDWDIRCMSATAMGRSARDVQGWALGYRRTKRTTAHPDEKLRYEAAVWRWVGPPAPGAPRVDA